MSNKNKNISHFKSVHFDGKHKSTVVVRMALHMKDEEEKKK
ncbi:hypothetical protein ACWE42_11145 [Sutcliffiella cohnii]